MFTFQLDDKQTWDKSWDLAQLPSFFSDFCDVLSQAEESGCSVHLLGYSGLALTPGGWGRGPSSLGT